MARKKASKKPKSDPYKTATALLIAILIGGGGAAIYYYQKNISTPPAQAAFDITAVTNNTTSNETLIRQAIPPSAPSQTTSPQEAPQVGAQQSSDNETTPLCTTSCNGVCTDIKNDANNCGDCGSKCDYLPDHGNTIFCNQGECDFTCGDGYTKDSNSQSPFYNTCIASARSSCYDTDGGKDIYTQGTCTSASDVVKDKCGTNTIVEEAYCTNNNFCSTQPTICTQGETCMNGACIQTSCTDPDGSNIYAQGTCKDITGTYIDACQQSQSQAGPPITEYICSTNNCVASTNYCPLSYVCSNGACTQSPTPPNVGNFYPIY